MQISNTCQPDIFHHSNTELVKFSNVHCRYKTTSENIKPIKLKILKFEETWSLEDQILSFRTPIKLKLPDTVGI